MAQEMGASVEAVQRMAQAIPLHKAAETFTDALCGAPYAQMFALDEVTHAGAQLQRLVQGLASHEGGLTLTGKDIDTLARRYIDEYYLTSRKEPLTQALARFLLESGPDVTPGGRQWLESEGQRSTSAVQQVEARRAQAASQPTVGK
jgi:hypothetical protein